MERRSFLKGSLAAPSLLSRPGLAAASECPDPPAIRPRLRQLHLEPSETGGLVIKSDALPHPRRLVRPEIIDQIWGPGTYETLRQPIHWQMIDDGWFGPEELWFPFLNEEESDEEYPELTQELFDWYVYHQPACEAHDILAGLFGVSYHFITGPGKVPELGLTLSEHPSSPRYATAKLEGPDCIIPFANEVERRSQYLKVDRDIRPTAAPWDRKLPASEAG